VNAQGSFSFNVSFGGSFNFSSDGDYFNYNMTSYGGGMPSFTDMMNDPGMQEIMCYFKNMPNLLEKCPVAPEEDFKIIYDCLSNLGVKVPCMVTQLFEKQPLDICFEEIMANQTVLLEYMEFFGAILLQCPDKCILEKMELLKEGDVLDSAKAAARIATYPLLKDVLSVENIVASIDSCMENGTQEVPENMSLFDMFNFTIGCRDTKMAFGCIADIVAKQVEPCFKGECAIIMANETQQQGTEETTNETTRRKRSLTNENILHSFQKAYEMMQNYV